MAKGRRPSFSKTELRRILNTTGGVCHVCAQPHVLARYGEEWVVDHVLSIHGGGEHNPENYLAACVICNGLKWMHEPDDARTIMALGTAARREAYKRPGSDLGANIRKMRAARLADNWARRAKTKSRYPDTRVRRDEARKLREAYVAVENAAIELLRSRKSRNFGWKDALRRVLSSDDQNVSRNVKGYRILADLEGMMPATQ